MGNNMRLNDSLNALTGIISKTTIPEYIVDNLAFELRKYQKEAIRRFLYYNINDNICDTDGNKIIESRHLLWQMATGSGKTLIMAALILEMYKQGYRNFWFFVNATDIITKTIDNFINSVANKYQFAQKIEIDGQVVQIKQVENFTNTNRETINIKFSTINILHQISLPEAIKENSVMLEDFAEVPIVLIADEAHHLNATTKKPKNSTPKIKKVDEESSWESSIQLLLKANKKNRLLEFTATANLTDKNIAKKYEDKLLYNYDLKKFREDKYSKDVFAFSTDAADFETIIIRAILISQYRKHIASSFGFALKPVILFKSKIVKENKENFEKFNKIIQNLTDEAVKKELHNMSTKNDIWGKASHYFVKEFRGKENDLCKELKDDFDINKKKVLLHDGTNSRPADQPKLLATLEDEDNPVRAIFVVNMLGEGWDVLNLFDIVRLYDSRDVKQGKPGPGTVSEAQLIGRGARYYPFGTLDKYRRKYDDNESEPLRAIEQMHYHCKENPRYISEIRLALMESGVMADDTLEIMLKMKKDFVDGKNKNFQEKNVYVNKTIEKEDYDKSKEELFDKGIEFVEKEIIEEAIQEQNVSLLPNFSERNLLEISLPTGSSKSQLLLENPLEMRVGESKQKRKLCDIVSDNIIRYALNSNKNFYFDNLQKAYPKLESMSQFSKIFGEQKVIIDRKPEYLMPDDLLFICKEVLNSLVPTIKEKQKEKIVTKYFFPENVGESFHQEIIRKYSQDKREINYDKYDWYVYENSVLTGEEQSFIKWFEKVMIPSTASGKTELEERGWSDIYLTRNEKAVKLFSWFPENLATGFEPDFVLFMKKNDVDYVFYIEPKGEHLLEYDKWKKDFLQEIEDVVEQQQNKSSETQNWKLIGMPFNSKEQEKFKETFEKKI
jgi:type III restriction enzyme